MNMVIAVFLAVVATVSYARTVRAARYGIISAPAVHYRLNHAGTTIQRCPVCISVSHSFLLQSPRTLTTSCWHFLFLFTLTLTTTFLFVLLLLYQECTSSSFYFAFCSKKRVTFSFLVLCSRWVCQLSRIQTVLGHLERFSVHWVNQTTVSTPVWSVFWLTVRSDIDLWFTRFCVLNCCVQLRKVKGYYDFGKQRQEPPSEEILRFR
jgi:hypothetical protein